MLRHLQIEDYALIERLEAEFHPGLNLLTGETGSGKSIVVDALALLLGEKGSSDLIRTGAQRARIVGVFQSGPSGAGSQRKPPNGSRRAGPRAVRSMPASRWAELRACLEQTGIESGDGDDLILQREILPAGRSRVFINNQPATVALLKSLAPYLAEIHGQNEQQELFEAKAQLDLLDRFGSLTELLARVEQQFKTWKDLGSRLEQLRLQNEEAARQRDLWEFQKREIEQAGLVPGEDLQLAEERQLLSHAEKIQSRLASSYELLYDAPHSAVSSIAAAQRQLQETAAFDAGLQPLVETLETAKASVGDLALVLRDRLARLEASPGRLEGVENRLAQLDRLKRKYAKPLDDILRYGAELRDRLSQMESADKVMEELQRQVSAAAKQYRSVAGALSSKRAKAAAELKKVVEKELALLAMDGTVFEAHLQSAAEESDWRATGYDRVEFLLSPNPGEPLRPLARIASGGETSRIMLALETVIATRPDRDTEAPDHTLVFDEVDAGIGGRAAETVGQKLRRLGESRQVLCVTHLPQIASFAHHHFRVEKQVSQGRTATQIHYLEGKERQTELARMLSGSQITPAVLTHAEQLLKANSA